MADKSIGSLPAAEVLDDGSLLLAEQQGEAVHFRGKQLKDYARQGVDALVQAARESAEKALQAAQDAQEAAGKVQDVTDEAEAAIAAAQAAENARAAAVQAAQYAEQVAALAAQNAAADVENKLQGYVDDAQSAKAGAEAAAGNAAAEAVQQAEGKLQGYVDDAEQAKQDAQNAAGTAAQDAVTAVCSDMAGYVSAAQAAQAAAEKARDEAQGIAGGDFASTAYVDNKAATAERNAKSYTDQKIAAIPTPDVSKQISEHNTATDSHADIRKAASDAASAAAAAQRTADGKEDSGTAAAAVNTHNTAAGAHNDIRLLINELTNRLNALANSEDVDLDQMAELVAYIKDNRELIDQITTGKVSVSDIIDNLTTNVANKPLSAAQGVALKALVDAAATAAANAQTTADGKQAKITGTPGQVVGFDTKGNPVAQEPPESGADITVNEAEVTLSTSGWTSHSALGYQQAATVSGLTAAANAVDIDVALSATDKDGNAVVLEAFALIAANPATPGTNSVRFYAESIPAVNVPIIVRWF